MAILNSSGLDKKITPKQALKRYFTLFIPSMTAYLILVFVAVKLIKGGIVSGPLLYVTGLLPGLAALIFLYGYFRYIFETDELQRKVQIEATLVGTGAVLTFTLTWGLMEMFVNEMPHIPMFWIFPFYFVVQGVASAFLSRKYGSACRVI